MGFAWELLPILASTEGELGGVTSTSWRSEDGEEADDPAGDPGIGWGGGSGPGLGFRLAGGGLGSGSDELDMHSITLPRPSLSNGFDPTAALEPFVGFSKLFRMLRGRDGLVFKSPVGIPHLFSSPSASDNVV